MASLSICIALHYITPFCQSLLSKPGNSKTKNLNSFIYSPYIHLTFSILIVGHSANFTLQNECSRRYINPPVGDQYPILNHKRGFAMSRPEFT